MKRNMKYESDEMRRYLLYRAFMEYAKESMNERSHPYAAIGSAVTHRKYTIYNLVKYMWKGISLRSQSKVPSSEKISF